MTALLFRDDATLARCAATVAAAGADGVRLDRTVFYPTGGGQPGDTGTLAWAGGALAVADTVKGAGPEDVVHRPAEPGAALPAPGTAVEAAIDWPRRHRHMRMHTALHLLCALVKGDVTGGQIGEARSRLDFNLPDGAPDRDRLTEDLNRLVDADHPVEAGWITDAELADRPGLVRTMSVKPPTGAGRIRLIRIGPADAPVDLQPCGGTHVARTAEIGRVEIARIESKGRLNRRIVLTLADA